MKYVADFETCQATTDKKDGVKVYLWGVMPIMNKKEDFHFGNNIETFLEYIDKQSIINDITIYFHNLSYDASYIMYHILTNGYKYDNNKKLTDNKTFNTLISNTGQMYCMKLKINNNTINFYDSMKLMNAPLKNIGKLFNIDKLDEDYDYDTIRENGCIPSLKEILYLKNDLLITRKFIKDIFFNNGMTRMTASSNAYSYLKKKTTGFRNLFPELEFEEDEQIRKAYKGGVCQVNEKWQNKDVTKGTSYDVNSLYPSVMLNRRLPVKKPIFVGKVFECKTSKYNFENIKNLTYNELLDTPLYIQSIQCTFKLKKGCIPTIFNNGCIKGFRNISTKNIDYDGFEFTGTMIDFWLAYQNYDIEILKHNFAYTFIAKGKTNDENHSIFFPFLDEMRAGKIKSSIDKNELMRTFYKLMQNMCYGKFGTSSVGDLKIPYLDKQADKVNFYVEKAEKATEYIPMAVFITSWARLELLHTIMCVGWKNVYYCDTDSIHSSLTKEEFESIIKNVDDNEYMCWKYEYTIKKGKFLQPKTYIEETTNNKLIVKCAGMSQNVKKKVTYDNFYVGAEYTGNLKAKNVKGGKMLIENTFKIIET